MASTLFLAAQPPMVATDDGPQPDDRYYVVGTIGKNVLVHGQDGTRVPKDAVATFFTGRPAWTWGQFAGAQRLTAAGIVPHEWQGEPTARDATVADFPKLSAVADVRGALP